MENNNEMILAIKIRLIKTNLLLELPSPRHTEKIIWKSDQGNDSSWLQWEFELPWPCGSRNKYQ